MAKPKIKQWPRKTFINEYFIYMIIFIRTSASWNDEDFEFRFSSSSSFVSLPPYLSVDLILRYIKRHKSRSEMRLFSSHIEQYFSKIVPKASVFMTNFGSVIMGVHFNKNLFFILYRLVFYATAFVSLDNDHSKQLLFTPF